MAISTPERENDGSPLLMWRLIDEAVESFGRESTVDTDAMRLAFTLRGASGALASDLQRRLRHADASPPRTLNALLLMHVRGEIEQGDLVRHGGFSKAAASTLVETLVADGLVLRRGSNRDRRIVLLSLTDAGHEVFLHDLEVANRGEAAWSSGLTPAERAMLVQLLVKLVDQGSDGGTDLG
ncbi:MarR family transcriptional regulator [Serinibacter arcticus]|uniref:MarR family transcriptional regulator n=1 Tax=Serinibacter arcticus TaxID=1655435 RepID=A0A2U1ZWJ2_9MICO|nr:MarR family transcriptional regulator [Serinibacter arcticus]PWD51348.1 MarR family transcriptional regulator [Serinibacter arcticus]